MEGSDVIFKAPKCKSQHASGNNPFDELWKNSVDTTTSEHTNRRSLIGNRLPGDFFDIGRRSLSFCDIDADDFGRESMGILPPDFGRDSSGFMLLNGSEFGRDSLGVPHIDALKDSFSFRRESLGILNLTQLKRESLDSGRESLGILHIKPDDFNITDEKTTIPDILLTAVEENEYLSNALNIPFLNPHLRKTSSVSSSSSLNPFNGRSLEGPSKIYSLSPMKSLEETAKSDVFNNAFYNNSDFNNLTYANSSIISSIHSPFNTGRLFSPSELIVAPTRIKSLPTTSGEGFEDETNITYAIGRRVWTADRTIRTKTLENRCFHGVLDFNQDTNDDFHDSVFIEGHHIAEKIADGSILNDSIDGEIGILDSTPQPEWPDETSENEDKEKEDLKCNTETVFKNVDKLLPAPILNTNFRIKTSKTDSNSSNGTGGDKINTTENNKVQISEKTVSKPIHNISDIVNESEKLSLSRKSESKSKDAKEILQNLSEIINCRNRSELQKSEGQNLLNSLANILCENKPNEKNTCLDDSGHSSIIDEQSSSPENGNPEYFGVMDLCRKTTNVGICNEHVSDKNSVDLSLKPIKSIADNRLSQSFSSSVPNIKTMPLNMIKKRNSSASGLDFNRNKSTASNNSSVNSNNSRNSSSSSRPSIVDGALKRKTLGYSVKKGPMKAVIPIGDMKKKNAVVGTPDRAEHRIPSITNRTSTPIKEPNLKPMAASTPTGRPIRDKKITPASLLERSKKENTSCIISKGGIDTTAPLPKSLIKLKPGLVRSNSVGEGKRTSENMGKITRSNSVEKETGIMSSLAKVRQNIVNSPYYQLKKQNALKESNNIGVPNSKEKIGVNKSLPDAKPTNLISKLKRPGKENMRK